MRTTSLATAVREKEPKQDKTVKVRVGFPLSPHSGSLETKKRNTVREEAPFFIDLTDELTDEDSGQRGKSSSEENDSWLPH